MGGCNVALYFLLLGRYFLQRKFKMAGTKFWALYDTADKNMNERFLIKKVFETEEKKLGLIKCKKITFIIHDTKNNVLLEAYSPAPWWL